MWTLSLSLLHFTVGACLHILCYWLEAKGNSHERTVRPHHQCATATAIHPSACHEVRRPACSGSSPESHPSNCSCSPTVPVGVAAPSAAAINAWKHRLRAAHHRRWTSPLGMDGDGSFRRNRVELGHPVELCKPPTVVFNGEDSGFCFCLDRINLRY